ncbi:MAG: SusD/RagB family nutrient-binding outer rane lipoprotein [Chitinophagaceae bacterium]|nr:SusD/RagB family nutrient-binding outer rane lipoprotein [Chitinophagaceae bacterium]
MKKHNYYIVVLFALLLSTNSCKKQYNDYTPDPNNPVTVPPYLVLRQILNDMVVYPFGDADKFGQFVLSSYTYYGTNEYWTGSADLNYGTLRNVAAMDKEAKRSAGDVNNPYSALAKFFKAYFFIDMSLKVGDVPMTEALLGLENPTPKYDSQKDVFKQSLDLLEQANNDLAALISAADVSLLGDFYFQERINGPETPLNALKSWQKVVNTYKLRVLIALSKKADDADLGVKQKFNDVLSDPAKYPIMESLDDNLQYVYNNAFNKYPNNKDNYGFDATRITVGQTWINTLSSLNDLRVMKIADPARGLGFADTDYRSFVGASNGEDVSTMGGKVEQGLYSLVGRKRYYDGYLGEPTFIVGYPEMCFNIAEAINRGWVTGDADSWYQKGIKADFDFYGVVDGDNTISFLRTLAPGDYVNYTVNFSYATYFNQPAVKYAGDNATGLGQILTQKYLAFGRNSGYEAYYQWRRTNVPTFSTGPGIGNSGVIPLRWQYPTAELSTNAANYTAAVQSQYGGDDNINLQMWIIK